MTHLFQARYRPHDSSLVIPLQQQDECFGRMTIEAAEALKDSLAAAIKTARADLSQPRLTPAKSQSDPAPPAQPGLPTMESMEKLVKAEDLVGPLKMPLASVYSFLQSVPDEFLVRLGRRLRIREAKFLAWVEAGCPR